MNARAGLPPGTAQRPAEGGQRCPSLVMHKGTSRVPGAWPLDEAEKLLAQGTRLLEFREVGREKLLQPSTGLGVLGTCPVAFSFVSPIRTVSSSRAGQCPYQFGIICV